MPKREYPSTDDDRIYEANVSAWGHYEASGSLDKLLQWARARGYPQKDWCRSASLPTLAIDAGDAVALERLLRLGYSASMMMETGFSLLHYAIDSAKRTRDEDIIRVLLKYGADLDSRDCNNQTPYERAIRLCRDDLAKLLQ